jgi:hypothetical protein
LFGCEFLQIDHGYYLILLQLLVVHFYNPFQHLNRVIIIDCIFGPLFNDPINSSFV